MKRIDNSGNLNRAGLIPYFIDDEGVIHMLFMVPTDNEWIASDPQISKGRIEPGEMTIATAIREAVEELGLKRSNLARIEPVGQYSTIMFYVGQVINRDDFDPPDPIETQATMWMTLETYMIDGRQLHVPVIVDAIAKIKEMCDVAE